jgi:Tfp pilus assembly protein PilF
VEARSRFLREQEERIKTLLKETVRSPKDLGRRCELAVLYLRRGRTEDGLQLLANILQEDAGHIPTHKALADYYEETGDAARASRHRQLAQGK